MSNSYRQVRHMLPANWSGGQANTRKRWHYYTAAPVKGGSAKNRRPIKTLLIFF
jgi:hypothetical protein